MGYKEDLLNFVECNNALEFGLEQDEFETDFEVQEYLKEIRKYGKLNDKGERYLLDLIKKGDKEALQTLFKKNLILAYNISKTFSRLTNSIFSMDLIDEANLALWEAITSYKEKLTVSFFEYINIMIEKRLREMLYREGKMIGINKSDLERMKRINKIEENLEKKNNVSISKDEIFTKFYGDYDFFQTEKRRKYFDALWCARDEIASLDGLDNREEILGSYEIEEDIIELDKRRKILEAIHSMNLTEEERSVLYYLFFIDNPKSTKEIGNILKISSSQVVNIKNRIIKKLRHPKYELYDYSETCLIK